METAEAVHDIGPPEHKPLKQGVNERAVNTAVRQRELSVQKARYASAEEKSPNNEPFGARPLLTDRLDREIKKHHENHEIILFGLANCSRGRRRWCQRTHQH